MEIDVQVDVTPNERRRFLGDADITPMVELVSEMLDQAMMAVVDARLAALTACDDENDAGAAGDGDLPMADRPRTAP